MVRSYHCRKAEVKIWGCGGTYARYVGLDWGTDPYQPRGTLLGHTLGGSVWTASAEGNPTKPPHKWRLGGLRTGRHAEECLTNSVNSG